jgi:alanine racemase
MIHLPHPYPLGEEVVLLGRQGREHITPLELATRWQVPQNDVTSEISQRVPRVYLGSKTD